MVIAYCLMKAHPGKDFRVFALMKRMKEVKEVALTYGTFDLIAKVEVNSSEDLNDFIFNILRKIQEIKETTTLITSRIEVGINRIENIPQ